MKDSLRTYRLACAFDKARESTVAYIDTIDAGRSHAIPFSFQVIEEALETIHAASAVVESFSQGSLAKRSHTASVMYLRMSEQLHRTVALLESSPVLALRASAALSDLKALALKIRKASRVFGGSEHVALSAVEDAADLALLMAEPDHALRERLLGESRRIGPWRPTKLDVSDEVERQLLYSEMPSPLPDFGDISEE